HDHAHRAGGNHGGTERQQPPKPTPFTPRMIRLSPLRRWLEGAQLARGFTRLLSLRSTGELVIDVGDKLPDLAAFGIARERLVEKLLIHATGVLEVAEHAMALAEVEQKLRPVHEVIASDKFFDGFRIIAELVKTATN